MSARRRWLVCFTLLLLSGGWLLGRPIGPVEVSTRPLEAGRPLDRPAEPITAAEEPMAVAASQPLAIVPQERGAPPPNEAPSPSLAMGATARAVAGEPPASPPVARWLQGHQEEWIYIPSTAGRQRQATVLVALHGMQGNGAQFGSPLIAEAEQNGWIILAPTLRYQNWHDPTTVADEDVTILRRLRQAIEALPQQTGLRLNRRVLLYGFSRGGQVAHRFALAFPDRVLGVATLSAGTYTLPDSEMTINGLRRSLPLPYGTADLAQRLEVTIDREALRRVGFWVAVGANDTRESDVPAAWTTYIGPHRLARARAFKAALDRLGAPADLAIFSSVDHREAPEMRQAACRYLSRLPGGPMTRSALS